MGKDENGNGNGKNKDVSPTSAPTESNDTFSSYYEGSFSKYYVGSMHSNVTVADRDTNSSVFNTTSLGSGSVVVSGTHSVYALYVLDPGPWVLVGTTVFCLLVMGVLLPLMVLWKRRKDKEEDYGYAEDEDDDDEDDEEEDGYKNMDAPEKRKGEAWNMVEKPETEPEFHITARHIVQYDKETRKILSRAIPYTFADVGSSIFENACLALIGNYVGTHALAAYAIVEVLADLTDGILYGPLSACSTLGAHAVGAGDTFMAGQYFQLSTIFYLLFNVPMIFFWSFCMENIVLWLDWGEQETAAMAQEYIRVYIYSYTLGGISTAVWELLEISGHSFASSFFSLLWDFMNFFVLWFVVTEYRVSLATVGWVYTIISVIFVVMTFSYAQWRGWMEPFNKGLFRCNGFKNTQAIKALMKQAVPLSIGYLLSSSEWAILTFFASYLGPAEVAAWAVLGSIWGIIECCTEGLGDAAEIRAAFHFGCNNPHMAKLTSYKSLFISMITAVIVSAFFMALQNELPTWFTVDERLQGLLAELVPYIGIANLSLQFGSTSCSLLGAQGKYKLVTWIEAISTWGITMPLSAFFVFVLRVDLQGITAASIIGYVMTGVMVSYYLLTTDWADVAECINEVYEDDDGKEDDVYAALRKGRNKVLAATRRRKIKFLTVQPGEDLGMVLGKQGSKRGTYVVEVSREGTLVVLNSIGDTVLSINGGVVSVGDAVLAVDGEDVTKLLPEDVTAKLLALRDQGYTLALTPCNNDQENNDEAQLPSAAKAKSMLSKITGKKTSAATEPLTGLSQSSGELA